MNTSRPYDQPFNQENVEALKRSFASTASHLICEDFVDRLEQFKNSNKGTSEQRAIISQLLLSCHLTTESALLLLYNGRTWDSEILLRSVIEGTIRFIYLLEGSGAFLDERFKEYWHHLPDIGELKRSNRVRNFLEQVSDPNAGEWRSLKEQLLSEDEEKSIRAAWPRQQRKEMEQRWAFNEITASMLRRNPEDAFLQMLATLSHGYGNSSHLIHMDGEGVGMIWERSQRPEERRYAVEAAHAARIASDAISFACIRDFHSRKTAGVSATEIFQRQAGLHAFLDTLKPIAQRWNDVEYGPNP